MLLITIVVGLVIWYTYFDWPPSDQRLIGVFQKNRKVFDALQQDICSLSESQTIMKQPSWSRPVVSDEVRQKYYRLLRVINATGISSIKNRHGIDCAVVIEVWARGTIFSADYKKYTYNMSTHPDELMVDTLDNLTLDPNKIQFFRRNIGGGWALEYAHWP